MARVKFTRRYDHTWPSRSMTTYPDNWEGTVKKEVADAAVAAGAARRVKTGPDGETVGIQGGKIDQAKPEERLPGNLPTDLAEPQALTPNLHVDDDENSQ